MTPVDSGLTLTAYPGEEEDVWVSGGGSLDSNADGATLEWREWEQNSEILVANVSSVIDSLDSLPAVTSICTTDSAGARRLTRARYPNSDPETDQWGYASKDNVVFSVPADAVNEWHRPPATPLHYLAHT